MRVLVTGATGYLGSHLVRSLLSYGCDVLAFRRQESDLVRVADISREIDWYYADETDLSLPFKRYQQIDAVLHTATCYGRNGEQPATIFEANTAFPVRLFEVAMNFHVNTFFNTDTIFSEYLNLYTLSKRQFASWAKMVSSMNKMRFVNIRLEHIYGPYDDLSKFTTFIIHQCLKNVEYIPLTIGEQLRDFIYIDDVVSAYLILLRNHLKLDSGYSEIGIGSGVNIMVKEFVQKVHRLCNSTSTLCFGSLPYRKYEIMQSTSDLSCLSGFGWQPLTLLDDGLTHTIAVEKTLL